MKRFRFFQQSLGWKLLLSYFVVIATGALVLAGMARLQIPTALARHLARMAPHLVSDPGLEADLYHNFADAVNEIILIGSVTALVVAVFISIYTTRRIVFPIRQMMKASRRIAAGRFDERVPIASRDELGELAHSFNQMAAALEETEQRRLDLIGDVAHELRTPLGNIKVVMEGLMDGVLPADAETYSSVQREIMRLQRVVQDLQELSRAEAGQIELYRRPLAPAVLIAGAVERLGWQYEEKSVDLRVDAPSTLPDVMADPSRVIQVLLNLLGNALQYTPPGGSVSVSARHVDDEVIFAVTDTGVGLSAEDIPHLFERFYRVDKSRSRAGGGSGIGLTISLHLVEAHGGRIWAESEGIGRGSNFLFTLPTNRH